MEKPPSRDTRRFKNFTLTRKRRLVEEFTILPTFKVPLLKTGEFVDLVGLSLSRFRQSNLSMVYESFLVPSLPTPLYLPG